MSNEETLQYIDEGMKALTCAMPKVKQALSSANIAVGQAEAYNKGLNDGYELGKKLWVAEIKGGLNTRIVEEIFDCDIYDVYTKYTPQEALAKLEAYEKEQNEIKVGDVIVIDDEQILVTNITKGKPDTTIDGIREEGEVLCYSAKQFTKTGKHIDIQSVLQQIAE